MTTLFRGNISVYIGLAIQTAIAITKDCGSEIYCTCSSIIHKGTQKSEVISIKHSRDNRISPLTCTVVYFVPVTATFGLLVHRL